MPINDIVVVATALTFGADDNVFVVEVDVIDDTTDDVMDVPCIDAETFVLFVVVAADKFVAEVAAVIISFALLLALLLILAGLLLVDVELLELERGCCC